MGLLSKYSSLCRIAAASKKCLYSKFIYPCAFNENFTSGIHTESLTSEKTSHNEELKSEQPVFIEEAVPHDVLVSHLLKCSSVKEQMVTLSSVLALSPEDIKQRHTISAMISDMLKPFFHDYSVQIFGSSVNGLGFKGCDVDMGFLTSFDNKELMPSVFDDSDIPTIEDVLSGKASPAQMSQLSGRDQLLFIHTVFLDHYTESTTAPIFINAYVPIIRFVHEAYRLKIDLSSTNKYGFYNSKLFYLLGKLDDRVYHFLMTIRYWAKNAGLIGGGLMFNTYCLTLLAVFFLQTRSPPVLPSIEYILNVPGANTLLSVDMSDYSFLDIIEKIPPSRNTESLDNLLREFFFYYIFFDFEKVICPHTTKCESRSLFSNTEERKKFKFNTICVQDPLKLTHNVANLVDYRHCRKFARDMLYACHLFQDKDKWIPKSELWGLAALFNMSADLEITKKYNINMPADLEITKKYKTSVFDSDYNLKFPLKWFVEKNRPLSEYALFLETTHLVINILEKTLLIKFEMMQGAENSGKHDTVLNEGDQKLLFLYKCTCSNIWLGRSNVSKDNISSDILDNSIALERELSLRLHQRANTEDKKNYSFLCKAYACKLNDEAILTLKLASSDNTNVNPVLGIFLKEFMSKVMRNVRNH